MVLSGGLEADLYFADEGSSEEDLNIQMRSRKARQLVLDEGKSGIGWKYANQGMPARESTRKLY